MSITLKKKNFAKSTLASGISDVAVSLTADTGDGGKFPSSGKFRAVLWGSSYINPSDDPNAEIVEAELDAGDTFDITRAKEGTSAQAWSASDNFAHIFTAGTLEEIETDVNLSNDRPAFSVNKNSTDQTGIVSAVFTKVTFSTEDFDTHDDFASSRFTPSLAGKYLITGLLSYTSTTDTTYIGALIYKNGAAVARFRVLAASGTSNQSAIVSAILEANGSTDYFEFYTWHTSSSDKTLDGDPVLTHFYGCRIG